MQNSLQLTVAGVGLGVLPHRAVTRELLAADLALELVLGQMLGAMLLHLLHRIEALRVVIPPGRKDSQVRAKQGWEEKEENTIIIATSILNRERLGKCVSVWG